MFGTKLCTICHVIKPYYDFYKSSHSKDGLMSECRQCNNERRKNRYIEKHAEERERRREYYRLNRETILQSEKSYRERNKEIVKARSKKYRATHKEEIAARAKARREQDVEAFRASRREYYAKNKERINERAKMFRAKYREKRLEYGRQYRSKNKDAINQKRVERLHSDLMFKLKEQSRNMLRCSFMTAKHRKNNHFFEIVGCTADELVEKLKNTWLARYGKEWTGEPCHIDHIVPLSTASTYEDVKNLCHYSNLQLLTPEDNMKKSNHF